LAEEFDITVTEEEIEDFTEILEEFGIDPE